jgi:hypothetical protein
MTSPRAWKVQDDFKWVFNNEDDVPIGECYGKGGIGEANAQFIVDTINAMHDQDHVLITRCAFCFKQNDEVEQMISGMLPIAQICNECLDRLWIMRGNEPATSERLTDRSSGH